MTTPNLLYAFLLSSSVDRQCEHSVRCVFCSRLDPSWPPRGICIQSQYVVPQPPGVACHYCRRSIVESMIAQPLSTNSTSQRPFFYFFYLGAKELRQSVLVLLCLFCGQSPLSSARTNCAVMAVRGARSMVQCTGWWSSIQTHEAPILLHGIVKGMFWLFEIFLNGWVQYNPARL